MPFYLRNLRIFIVLPDYYSFNFYPVIIKIC